MNRKQENKSHYFLRRLILLPVLLMLSVYACTNPPASDVASQGQPAPDQAKSVSPNAHDACRVMKGLMGIVIGNHTQDVMHQKAVDACVKSGALAGKTRVEIEKILGPGRRCEKYFISFGFGPDDIYYPVGKLPENYDGGVPSIVLGFVKGVCVKSRAIHTQ